MGPRHGADCQHPQGCPLGVRGKKAATEAGAHVWETGHPELVLVPGWKAGEAEGIGWGDSGRHVVQ